MAQGIHLMQTKNRMKLQTKINYRFLVLLLFVFLFSGGILYVLLSLVVDNNLNEILEHRSERVKQNLITNPAIAYLSESPDQSIQIKPTVRSTIPVVFSDTLMFDRSEKEFLYFRKITFGAKSKEKFYEITIVLSKLETEDLVELIFYFMLGLFGLIGFILFLSNRWLSSAVWNPFYNTLEQLTVFKIGQKQNVEFIKTDITEFEQLNSSLSLMVQKAQSDFKNLKEFTENASHEIQTPIAIIKSKLESALQDKTISKLRYNQIQSAYESVSRLSKLNEALLLLSKIENRQFVEEIEINLCDIINQRLELIEELFDLKKIKITIDFKEPVISKINPYLAEIMVNNLLNNALKHNFEGGEIIISTSAKKVTFSNTGSPLNIAPESLFQRFAKHNTGSESTGLGLAIVSEICKSYNLSLRYDYQNRIHSIIIVLDSDNFINRVEY